MAEITIKSVEGNPLNINVVMTAVEHSMLNGEIVTETVDFYPDTSKPVRAYLDCTTARKQFCPTTYVDGNIVYLSCDNATAGVYTLTVTCTDTNGKARRYKSDACIEVYDLTSAAEIAGSFDEQTYEMNGVFYTFGGGGTVQSDWDETNPESPAYILNKPDLSDYATDEELQAVEEQIPNVPEWAQQPQKPSYTAGEVGAVPTSRTVNGKALSEDITLNAQDVGAQTPIADLAQIREGAAKGATAYQKPSTGIAKSDLTNGIQQSLDRADTALQAAALTPLQNQIDTINNKIPTDATSTNELADKNYVERLVNEKQDTINDLDAIRRGAAKGATAYQLPSNGMPKTDLAVGVQQSLDKANTAYQKPSAGIPKTDLAQEIQQRLDIPIDDEPTAGSNNLVKSGGVYNELVLGAVYDVSSKNPTAGPNNDGKWESLSALLSDANLYTIIPTSVRKGGMSIKFVQSSDRKYVQWRLTATSFTTDTTKWVAENEDFKNEVMQEVNEAIESITPIEITGDVTNAPDEEDLTSVNQGGTDVLKFKDKAYTPLTYSGMGRVYLRKNLVNGVNTLTQDMFYKGEAGSRVPNTNTIYVIQYDFTLSEDVTIPANCILEFDGGSINGIANLTFSNTYLKNVGGNSINTIPLGTISNDYIQSSWFGINENLNDVTSLLNALTIFALRNNCELIIDTDININGEWLIYDASADITPIRRPGPKVSSINGSINVNLNNSNAKITIKASAVGSTANHSFYDGGWFNGFVINGNASNIDYGISVQGWWRAKVSDILIKGNNKITYGIRTADYVDNPDWTCSILEFENVRVSYCTSHGFYNPGYLTLINSELNHCSFEHCDVGVRLSGLTVSFIKSSASYNRIGVELGGFDAGHRAKAINLSEIEIDGLDIGEYGIIFNGCQDSKISNCRFFSKISTKNYYAIAFKNSTIINKNNTFENCFVRNDVNSDTYKTYIVKNKSIDNDTFSTNFNYNIFIDTQTASYGVNYPQPVWSDGDDFFYANSGTINCYNKHFNIKDVSIINKDIIEVTEDITASEANRIFRNSDNKTIIIKAKIDLTGSGYNLKDNITLIFEGGYIEGGWIGLNSSSKVLPSYDYLKDSRATHNPVIYGNPAIGTQRFINGIPNWWNGTAWIDATSVVAGTQISGTFANKPTVANNSIPVGFRYFCTDKQTTEGATDGIEIIHKGNDVWVDALGRVVS